MIDPGTIVAIVAVVVTVSGGAIKWARDRGKELRAEHGRQNEVSRTKIDKLEQEKKLLEQAMDAKDDAIADLRSQRDRLQITADLMDRFLNQLPPKRRTSGD